MSGNDFRAPLSGGFSQRLQAWRNYHRFIEDPFASFEAEREQAYLPNIFVERAYFSHVMGDPLQPQTAILVARRGEGKTATRGMIAYNCAVNKKQRLALPIHYFDFSFVLDQVGNRLEHIEARHHVAAIIRAGLYELVHSVPLSYFQLIKGFDRELLMGYTEKYADPIVLMRLRQILNVTPIELGWDALTCHELLNHFVNLVTQLGPSETDRFKAVYVLVDQVDETRLGSKAAIDILEPLVREGPLLNLRQLAFKFFLQVEIGHELRSVMVVRPDRIVIETITWDEASLREVVTLRLQEFSRKRIENLEELCDYSIKRSVMDRLIEASDHSPRVLLRLCHYFIFAHIMHGDSTNYYLNSKDLAEALLMISEDRHQVIDAAVVNKEMPAPPAHGLFLDKNGHIWIDHKELEESLSGLIFVLFKTLYQRSPEIVTSQELIDILWPNGSADSDEQNLRKHINRLRDRLKNVSGQEKREYIKTLRGRGYWMDLNG